MLGWEGGLATPAVQIFLRRSRRSVWHPLRAERCERCAAPLSAGPLADERGEEQQPLRHQHRAVLPKVQGWGVGGLLRFLAQEKIRLYTTVDTDYVLLLGCTH